MQETRTKKRVMLTPYNFSALKFRHTELPAPLLQFSSQSLTVIATMTIGFGQQGNAEKGFELETAPPFRALLRPCHVFGIKWCE